MKIPFGTHVLVRAEAVRVIVEEHDGGHRFKQASSQREAGRFVRHEFDPSDRWPGAPIAPAWEPKFQKGFDVDPTPNGRVLVRVRRLELGVAETGIVVGQVLRWEGVVAKVTGGSNDLVGPTRKVTLLEVALPPTPTGKARFVLAHRNDIAPIPAPVLTGGR